MRANLLLLGCMLLACAGCGSGNCCCCGCLGGSSGTWNDDPKNYGRAWGVSKPDDVVMVHSWYWRSPHFTREEAYFFEFQKHPQLLQSFIAANGMTPAVFEASKGFAMEKPSWFLPKPFEAYEAWYQPTGDAWAFRDKETGEIFIYACQL